MLYGTFFTISNDNITSTIGYAKDLIADTLPMWILIIGVALGLIVFEVVVNVIRGRH